MDLFTVMETSQGSQSVSYPQFFGIIQELIDVSADHHDRGNFGLLILQTFEKIKLRSQPFKCAKQFRFAQTENKIKLEF